MPILRGHDSKGPYLKLSDGSFIYYNYRYVKLTTGETLSKPSISSKTWQKKRLLLNYIKENL